MDTYKEFCIRFWESTRNLDLYSMDGTQLDRLIVDALSKTNGGGELIKTSMNELSVLISAFNHNNGKIQSPSLPSNLDKAAEISDLEAKNLADDYTKFLAAGLTKNEPRPIGPQWMKILASDRFKAGAEWMAGQGYTKEETVYFERLCDENRIMVDLGWGEPERGGFNPGDKVIVQIRKK